MANDQRARERHLLFYFEVYQISMRPSVLGRLLKQGEFHGAYRTHVFRPGHKLCADVRLGEVRRERYCQDAIRAAGQWRSGKNRKHHESAVRNAAIGWVTPSRNATEVAMVSIYVLALLVVLLVIYLFYAIIHPEKI